MPLMQISHGNTARHALEHGDDVLAKICGLIASDEGRHEVRVRVLAVKLTNVLTFCDSVCEQMDVLLGIYSICYPRRHVDGSLTWATTAARGGNTCRLTCTLLAAHSLGPCSWRTSASLMGSWSVTLMELSWRLQT
jgi:hypothetical protein